jgi:hypothetical protein
MKTKYETLLVEMIRYFCWPEAMAKAVDPRTIQLTLEVSKVKTVFRLRIDQSNADGKPVLSFRGKQYSNPGQKYDLFHDVFRAIREAIAAGTDGKPADIG